MSAEFVAHMEDVLDLYAEPYDSQRPVVCFDETSSQLLADARPALPARRLAPRLSLGSPCGRTTSTGGRARATCLWPVSRWRVGGRWR